MQRNGILLSLLVSLSVAACADGGGAAPVGGAPFSTRTVRERCEAVASAICARWTSCGVVTGTASIDCVPLMIEGCCATDCSAMDPYATAAVDLCIDETAEPSCTLAREDPRHGIPNTCDGMF